LYIDAEGWLSSRSFSEISNGPFSDEAVRKKFGMGYYEFMDRMEHLCEHERGVFIKAIRSSSVIDEFQDIFKEAKVEPQGDPYYGFYPADCAPTVLKVIQKRFNELTDEERRNIEWFKTDFNKFGTWNLSYWVEHVALLCTQRLCTKAMETGHPIWFQFM
ncbi:MAG: hypothetical protein E6Z30_01095, partial [Atopobium minutum]|nr:hypothetical protein [Atopobium minutum]